MKQAGLLQLAHYSGNNGLFALWRVLLQTFAIASGYWKHDLPSYPGGVPEFGRGRKPPEPRH
jgi:hypothetical protein